VKVFRSFQGKLLLFFLLIDVATVGILIATVSSSAREALETSSREHLLDLARFASQDIDEQLRLGWTAVQSLASHPFILEGVEERPGRSPYLEPFMQQLSLPGLASEDSELWLLDLKGRVLSWSGRNQARLEAVAFAQEPWWQRIQHGHPAARVLSEEGRMQVLVASPVVSQGHVKGALVARFDLAFVHAGTVREGFDVVLLEGETPLLGKLPAPVIRELRALSTDPTRRDSVLLGETFYLVVPVEGFAREHGFKWSLVLSVPAARISGPVEVLRQRMLQGAGATALLLVLVVAWRTQLLLRPLKEVRDTMRRITRGGELNQRLQLQSKDELGSIARNFNQMLDRLEQRTGELERSKEQLSLLAQITSTSPNAIIMFGTEGWIRVWNEAAEKLFGWPRLEVLGTSFVERAVPKEARARFTEVVARARLGEPVDTELTVITGQAGVIPVQLIVSRILDAQGHVQGHVCIVRDLREYKRLRESLVQSEKMAAVGTLVAGLSHELNNPLGIILGFAQGLLRKSSLDDASRTALASIEKQTQRCAGLVRALLEFSRRSTPQRERIDVGAMLARVRELAGAQAQRGQVRLEILAPAAEDLLRLEANMPELESALMSLIGNALDATPPGGRVYVGARGSPAHDGIELFVTDTGSGMPPDVLPRIFDPFFSTKPVGQGTGLGLSITRSIVEAHGGRIDVETALGTGTTVRLRFPGTSAPAPRAEASP
jgi:PAS domain S-box-containing protein